MADWTQEQLQGAGNWLASNIGDRGTVMAEAARLGLSENDLLAAARTQSPGISLGDVRAYMSGGQPAAAPAAAAAPALRQYQKNPYLDQMAAGITQQATRNLNEQILPGLRSQAVAAGGYGDARSGIAEGLAVGRTNDAIAREVTNLYGNDYNNDMNRALQQYGIELQNQLGQGQLAAQNRSIDNQFALGQGGLANQRYGIDVGASTSRYGTDKGYEVGMANANASMANAQANQALGQGQLALGQQKLGVDLSLGLLDRQMAYNNVGIQMGTNIQNTPADQYDRFNQQANSLGRGYPSQNQSNSGGGSDPLMGVAGIARVGQSWLNQSNTGQFQPGMVGQGLIDNQAAYNSQIGFS